MRIDFVCDTYPVVSVKNAERCRRTKGGTLIVKNNTGKRKVPLQWKQFLSVDENKGQLSHFLAKNGEMNVTQGSCMANHCLYPTSRNVTEYVIQLLELSHSW